ncbi:MAG: hypothetical protein RIT35_1422 [Pseudomonadota bacterium]
MNIRKPFLMFALVPFLSGCPNPTSYQEPITRFQQASTIVIEGARSEYGLANSAERNAEIDRLVAAKSRIDLSKLNDPAIRLLGPDDLNVRLVTLDTLAKHGQLLLILASSDAPTRAKDAANSLDGAIVGLSSSLGKTPSDKFKSSVEGFATIAGEAATLALDAKISEALDKAIAASDKSVTEILTLIKDDLGYLYERRRSNLSAARKYAVDAYNLELDKQVINVDTLKKSASEIKKTEDAWDTLPLLLGAGPGLDAMAEVHQKLVQYAKSSKSPQDLAELVEATDAFVTRAKIIADAIKTIKETKE